MPTQWPGLLSMFLLPQHSFNDALRDSTVNSCHTQLPINTGSKNLWAWIP